MVISTGVVGSHIPFHLSMSATLVGSVNRKERSVRITDCSIARYVTMKYVLSIEAKHVCRHAPKQTVNEDCMPNIQNPKSGLHIRQF